MSVVSRILWWSLKILLFPILITVREAIRHAPKRIRTRILGALHKQADLLFYEGRIEDLGVRCSVGLKCFPDDAKLHSMYAIALADTDPEKSTEMAKRATELSSGSL